MEELINKLKQFKAADDSAKEMEETIKEAIEIIESIKEYNKLSSNELNIGDTIYIINPKIGELKRDIVFLRHQLKESLIKVEKKEV